MDTQEFRNFLLDELSNGQLDPIVSALILFGNLSEVEARPDRSFACEVKLAPIEDRGQWPYFTVSTVQPDDYS